MVNQATVALRARNVYVARFDVGTASNQSHDLFLNQTTTWGATGAVYNDLPDGRLPDNRAGVIVGMYLRIINAFIGATSVRQGDYETILQLSKLELQVAGIQVVKGPTPMFPPQGGMVSRGEKSIGTAADNMMTIQNEGRGCGFEPHPVNPYEQIRVVYSDVHAGAKSAATQVEVGLIVDDERAIKKVV